MTITERKYMYPLATPTQKKLLRQTMKNRHRKIPFKNIKYIIYLPIYIFYESGSCRGGNIWMCNKTQY